MSVNAKSHGAEEAESRVAGMLDLRVVIVPDGSAWFAQGLEIDYAVQGETLDDAKSKFQSGLAATVNQHQKVFGTIKGVLRVAPQDAWDLMYSALPRSLTYLQLTELQIPKGSDPVLPFRGIQFIESRHGSEATL